MNRIKVFNKSYYNLKGIEIGEYLKTKIDTKKAKARIFQNKIKRFQALYGLDLIEPLNNSL